MPPRRFRGLTKAQENALGLISMGRPPHASPRTIQALKDAGLITESQRVVGRDRFGAITVPDYEMPTPVHIEWCSWCADNFPDPPF